ncbi:MAG TPA: LysR family transcriptional regulator [Xanthomonadales bacterium]|nr:LysR family transcriptional regulator [Xanthomonadales bacterium]
MAANPRISLEQWRALVAVVDAGGYAQAAERLHKSQSAVTYAVQKLQSLLGVEAFRIEGRKAVLTDTGHLLYRRGQALLEEAEHAEHAARTLSAGWEAEIRLAVEIVFPSWLLLAVLDRFGAEAPNTRIELLESVLGGTAEALLEGRADLAVTPQVPPGFLGAALMRMRAVPMAAPTHPLHALGRPLTLRDLRAHRHVVVRDTGSRRTSKSMWLEAKQRWTVSHIATSIEAVVAGYGFAWFVEERVRRELESGALAPLPIAEGGERFAEMYLVLADPEGAGPGVRRLATLLREGVAAECGKRGAASAARPTARRRAARR